MILAAMSARASSVQSHGERLRPSESGRSQARRTTWIATSGGNPTPGTVARGVCEPGQALRQTVFAPLADHRPLDAYGAAHIGRDDGGRPLPAFQGRARLVRQTNA
jgi:hypothetical protein